MVPYNSPEVLPCKISANREQNKIKNEVFVFFYAEVPPNLSTISANREQNKIKNEVFEFFYAEVPPNLSTISASRAKYKMKSPRFSFLFLMCCLFYQKLVQAEQEIYKKH